MLRASVIASAVTAILTALVGAGTCGELPRRAMPVLLTAWGAGLTCTAILWALRWTVTRLLGNLRAVRDLASIVDGLTRDGASRPGGPLRQAR